MKLTRSEQRLGRRQSGAQRHLVVDTRFDDVHGRRHLEDHLVPLLGQDTARGERPSVARALDVERDRHTGTSRPQEVGVQRVRTAVRLDRRDGGPDRLRRDLTAEHPVAPPGVGVGDTKPVRTVGFQVQDVQQTVDGVGHGPTT